MTLNVGAPESKSRRRINPSVLQKTNGMLKFRRNPNVDCWYNARVHSTPVDHAVSRSNAKFSAMHTQRCCQLPRAYVPRSQISRDEQQRRAGRGGGWGGGRE